MRPITTDPSTASYSAQQQLARTVTQAEGSGRNDDDEPPTKRRRTVATTVGTQVAELDSLVKSDWITADGKWKSDASRLMASRTYAKIGNGYEAATRSLIAQAGQYCACCDAPVFSDLRATPTLPPRWFPAEAFDYTNLLLMCACCRFSLGESLSRTNGNADALKNPSNLAWPQRFAQALPDGALLPFRFPFMRLAERRDQPKFAAFIEADERDGLLRAYRRGQVQVERSETDERGWVIARMPGSAPFAIAVGVVPTSTQRSVESGVGNLIDLAQLNRQCPGGMDRLDRRLELRTMAALRAHDLYDQLSTARAEPDPTMVASMSELLGPTIQATGFWGVWLTVFSNEPGFQAWLAGLLPGTSPRSWVL
jgi:hypothetical protein